jgi:nicotinate-nucleotide pyrophosphorylase (carboxylating)
MKIKLKEYLSEDVGTGDETSALVVPEDSRARGRIICKEDCVLAGIEETTLLFSELGISILSAKSDGTRVAKGEVVMEVEGNARALLAGERLALNIVMRMSGIATVTEGLARRCRQINPRVRIAATRKTTPGFRRFEKKAVAVGGGDPHRMGLYDSILIKNNHIRLAGGVAEALRRAKLGSFTKKIEIEVESAEDAMIAAENGADIVMLDNFPPEDALLVSKRIRAKRPEVLIEVSGGITPSNIEEYAPAADIISLGWLTHSFKSVDFSMHIEPA